MISLRYHVISISAVFLALAVGVVLGSTALSNWVLAGFSGQQSQLGRQVADLQSQRDALNAQIANGDRFATGVGAMAVRGLLAQRTVVLIGTDTASQADEDAIRVLLSSAGANVTGQVQLTTAFTDPSRSDELRDLIAHMIPAGAQLPVAADPGTLAGGLFGDLLLLNKQNNNPQATPDERAAALDGLASGGYIQPVQQVLPAQLAVVVTGGHELSDSAADRATMLARFATQLERTSAGVVLAGATGSADGSGPVGVVRADKSANSILSTVDDSETAAGRVVTIMALQSQLNGRVGSYGNAGNAQSPVPEVSAS